MTRSTPTIAFFGTPELAVWVLEELERAGIRPALVVTAPDRRAGRGLTLSPPPTKVWADAHDVAVLQTASLKDRAAVPELANTEWDLFIVAAYNIILPEWVLALPQRGVLNVHPSLLPKLRGPSPVRSAILRDERDAVGVTVIALDKEVDHGPIVAQATVDLPEWPVRGRLLDEILFREGGRLLAEVVPLWQKGEIPPEEQDHSLATHTTRFKKEDGELDLFGDPYHTYLQYCAMDGWPGTFFFVDDQGKRVRIKVGEASFKDGVFSIETVIPEGKKETPWEAVRTRYGM